MSQNKKKKRKNKKKGGIHKHAEVMTVRFNTEQVLEQMFQNIQQQYNYEEGGKVSEEEEEEEEAEEEVEEEEAFLSKNGQIKWSSAAYDK